MKLYTYLLAFGLFTIVGSMSAMQPGSQQETCTFIIDQIGLYLNRHNLPYTEQNFIAHTGTVMNQLKSNPQQALYLFQQWKRNHRSSNGAS